MTSSPTATLPQVMHVLDLATGEPAALEAALVQAAQRVAHEQGVTLAPERLAQAAHAVARLAGDTEKTTAKPIKGWSQRPATEAERQARLKGHSRGLKGWIRRLSCSDQGKDTWFGQNGPLLAIPAGIFALGTLLGSHNIPAFILMCAGMMGYMFVGLFGAIWTFSFKALLPARLDEVTQRQLQADPASWQQVQACLTSAIPMVLQGDLRALIAHNVERMTETD